MNQENATKDLIPSYTFHVVAAAQEKHHAQFGIVDSILGVGYGLAGSVRYCALVSCGMYSSLQSIVRHGRDKQSSRPRDGTAGIC